MGKYILNITPAGGGKVEPEICESEEAAHAALLDYALEMGYTVWHGDDNSTRGGLEGPVISKYGDRYWETVGTWTVGRVV